MQAPKYSINYTFQHKSRPSRKNSMNYRFLRITDKPTLFQKYSMHYTFIRITEKSAPSKNILLIRGFLHINNINHITNYMLPSHENIIFITFYI